MICKSKRYNPRPKARDVLLTWARAGAYEDRSSRIFKTGDLAHDRNIQKRFIAIARHYCTLAEIERYAADETSQQNHQSQDTIARSPIWISYLFRICFIDYYFRRDNHAPFDLAHASDCLAAPNSPAPKGSHWYYHLTDQLSKSAGTCVLPKSRLSIQRRKQVRLTLPCLQQAPGRPIQPRLMTLVGHSRQIEPPTKAIHGPASDTMPNRSASQIAPREDTELPASQERPSSDIGVAQLHQPR